MSAVTKSDFDLLKASFQDLEVRVIRLENIQQDPTAYRHTSEPRAWAAVESLIATGLASGSAVEEMKAKFPILVLLSERMQERERLLSAVNSHKSSVDHLREEVDKWKNELGACQADRRSLEAQADRLRSKLRQMQRIRRNSKRMVLRLRPLRDKVKRRRTYKKR